MNATFPQLETQYNRAKRSGWIPHFLEAEKTISKNFFDVADLMAIASRETNLDPKWLTTAGDQGNGYGLMQIDKRYFPEFVASGKWRDARLGILYGTRVLIQKWNDTISCIGKRVSVKSSKNGVTYWFVGKRVSGVEAQKVSIAAYNAGRFAHYAVSTGRDADRFTTGRDYSKDVMQRASVFRRLLKADGFLKTEIPPKPEPEILQTLSENTAFIAPQAVIETQAVEVPPTDTPADKPQIPESVNNFFLKFGEKVWLWLLRPLALLYAALEAGNIAAWLGVAVVVIFAVYLIYQNRDFLKSLVKKFFYNG